MFSYACQYAATCHVYYISVLTVGFNNGPTNVSQRINMYTNRMYETAQFDLVATP